MMQAFCKSLKSDKQKCRKLFKSEANIELPKDFIKPCNGSSMLIMSRNFSKDTKASKTSNEISRKKENKENDFESSRSD